MHRSHSGQKKHSAAKNLHVVSLGISRETRKTDHRNACCDVTKICSYLISFQTPFKWLSYLLNDAETRLYHCHYCVINSFVRRNSLTVVILRHIQLEHGLKLYVCVWTQILSRAKNKWHFAAAICAVNSSQVDVKKLKLGRWYFGETQNFHREEEICAPLGNIPWLITARTQWRNYSYHMMPWKQCIRTKSCRSTVGRQQKIPTNRTTHCYLTIVTRRHLTLCRGKRHVPKIVILCRFQSMNQH